MEAAGFLTLDQFHSTYGQEPGYEYWFGQAVKKGVPTSLHGILQFVMMLIFSEAGYKTGSEIELHIDPDWEPRPDVLMSPLAIEQPYPTSPGHLSVVEILSPDDTLTRLFLKCRNYARIGIQMICVLDPQARDAWVWSTNADNIERVEQLIFPDGWVLSVSTIWEKLDKQLK